MSFFPSSTGWFDDLSFHNQDSPLRQFDDPCASDDDALTALYGGDNTFGMQLSDTEDFVYSFRLNGKIDSPKPCLNPLSLHDASLLPEDSLADDSFSLPVGSCTTFSPPHFSPCSDPFSLADDSECAFVDIVPDASSPSSSSFLSPKPLPHGGGFQFALEPFFASPPISIKQEPAAASPSASTACSFPPSESSSTVPRRRRTNSTGNPSYKVASRIKALELLFSAQLPSFCPSFLTPDTWARLQAMSQHGTLVQFNSITSNSICVTIPEEYDLTIHSRANYGEELKEFTQSTKTRFRWWSDAALDELKPIKNRADPPGMIQRTVTLPESFVRHPVVERLVEGRQFSKLLRLISRFFNHLLQGYLHTDDRSVLDAEGFGRSRKKPRPVPHIQIPFASMVDSFLAKIDLIVL